MTLYLLYSRTGREFDVTAELHEMGIDAWCGRCIKWKRVGKRRRPDPYEEPAIPNYIFAEMSPDEFYVAQSVKFVSPTMAAIPQKAVTGVPDRVDPETGKVKKGFKGFNHFKEATERAYSEQDALRGRVEAPMPEFAPQAPLQPVSGPFADLLLRFRRIVNPDDPLNRRVEVDGPIGVMQFDPLDLKVSQ